MPSATESATERESAVKAPASKPANPAPLGLAAFGLTTVVLSSINAGILPPQSVAAVVPLAFAFGGLGQLIAGVLEFKSGNTFGTVAFTSYGAFWWWFAFLLWTVGAGWLKPPAAAGVAATLLMWGIFTAGLWLCTFKSNKGVFAVFLFLTITFFLLAGGDFGWAPGKKLGGYIGLLTGALALYVAFAELLQLTFGEWILPLGEPIVK